MLTYAEFVDQDEADVEDMFGPELFSRILNNAYNLSDDNILDEQKLLNADKDTSRLVKKAEAYFNLLSTDIPTFCHFTPSNWLIKNIDVLSDSSQTSTDVMDRFESLFKKLNSFL